MCVYVCVCGFETYEIKHHELFELFTNIKNKESEKRNKKKKQIIKIQRDLKINTKKENIFPKVISYLVLSQAGYEIILFHLRAHNEGRGKGVAKSSRNKC